MFTYLLGLITLGVGIVVYLIKRNVFNCKFVRFK
jgi:hypothetical protein